MVLAHLPLWPPKPQCPASVLGLQRQVLWYNGKRKKWHLQSVFIGKKLELYLKPKEIKPSIINQQ